MKTAFTIFLLLILSTDFAWGQAQPTVQHPGLVLFEQGKFAEAARALEVATKTEKYKSDAEIWNSLGLAYLATDQLKNSRKAFEKSVSLGPGSAVFRSNLAYVYMMSGQINKALKTAAMAITLDPGKPGGYQVRGTANFRLGKFDLAERDADQFIQLDQTNPQAYLLKADILIAKFGAQSIKDEGQYLRRANETLEAGSAKCKVGAGGCAEIVERREVIGAFYRYFSTDHTPPSLPGAAPTPEPGVTPLIITYQPRARYTDRARSENVQGAIRVAILLGASGKVESILFLSRLGFGLDEEVIGAVKSIQFEPKKKDGKPISTVVIREYTFTIY